MSVLIQPENINRSTLLDRDQQGGISTTEEPGLPGRSRLVRREYEPPEEAFEDSEAPEHGARLRVEAPDAGEPQSSHEVREFKHGRSRG